MRFANHRILAVLFLTLTWWIHASAQSVRLDWNPSATATSYTVYYGETSACYDITLPVGPATSAAIAGLAPEHTYYFAVTASNSAGESPCSEEVSYTVPPDTTRPTVRITSPVNGAQVQPNTTITIRAKASDNIGVSRVEFWINNVLKCVDGSTAFTCAWKVPAPHGVTYSLKARAYDAANNWKNSTVITVRSN